MLSSIHSLLLRRLLVAVIAVPLLSAGLPGCDEGRSDDEEEEDEEDEEEEREEEKPEAPVCGDGVCEDGETNACSDCAPPATSATLVVVNSSSYSMWYFYMTPCSSSTWGQDLLGENVLVPGNSAELTDIPPGCYDVRAETEGHQYYWESLANSFIAGETYTWTVSD